MGRNKTYLNPIPRIRIDAQTKERATSHNRGDEKSCGLRAMRRRSSGGELRESRAARWTTTPVGTLELLMKMPCRDNSGEKKMPLLSKKPRWDINLAKTITSRNRRTWKRRKSSRRPIWRPSWLASGRSRPRSPPSKTRLVTTTRVDKEII